MNFKSLSSEQPVKRISVLIFTLMTIFTFSLYWISHKFLADFSINLLSRIQNNRTANDFKIFRIIYQSTNEYICYIILIIIYNYANTFKSFVLFSTILLTKFLAGFFRNLFKDLPPCSYEKVPFCVIMADKYTFPSEKMILYPIFFWMVWYMGTKKMTDSTCGLRVKYFLLFLLILFILMLGMTEIILGVSTIDQVFFSMLISFCIYYLLFEVLRINFSNSRQFYKIITSSLKFIFAALFGVYVLLLIIFLLTYNEIEEVQLVQSLITSGKLYEEKNSLVFTIEAINCSVTFLSIVFLFIGFKLELKYTFDNQYPNWSQFNFEPGDELRDYSSGSMSSLSERISITKGAQWNHTGIYKSFARLLIVAILTMLCFSPRYLNLFEDSIVLKIVFDNLLCWSLCALGGSWKFKDVLKALNLTNLTLWTIMRDSL